MTKLLLSFFFCGLATCSIFAQLHHLFPVEKRGKAGYIDDAGRIVIPLKFDEAWPFREGLAAVRVGRDWGFIDPEGKFAIRPQFFEGAMFDNGRAFVGIYWEGRKIIYSTVGEYGYINRMGEIIKRGMSRDPKFHDGRAAFATEGNMPGSRTGYKDESGNIIIQPKFLHGKEFSEGLACVYTEKGNGFIDVDGSPKIPFQYENCGSFSEGLASVMLDGLIGFVDKSGKMVISPRFIPNPGKEIRFSDGVAVVQVGEGEKMTESGVRDVNLTGGNILAKKTGLFGVIDKTGAFIISPKYVQIGDFEDGLAWVNLGDAYIIHGDAIRWGYINKRGKIVWKSF